MKDPHRIDDTVQRESVSRVRFLGRRHPPKRQKRLPKCAAASSNKVSFNTYQAAERARTLLLHSKQAKYLRVYQCPHCSYWHLTSKKPLA